jgi:hypothetical protein
VRRNPLPLISGLPPEFPDLVGGVEEVITHESIGQTRPELWALEMKDEGDLTVQQADFLTAINAADGRPGIARGTGEAFPIELAKPVASSLRGRTEPCLCTQRSRPSSPKKTSKTHTSKLSA